jgi:hypothetical protein
MKKAVNKKMCVAVFNLMMVLTTITLQGNAQKYKSKDVKVNYYTYAKVLLDSSRYHNYTVTGNMPDYMGGNYALARLLYNINGLRRNNQGGDIEVMVSMPYYYQPSGYTSSVQTGTQKEKVNGVETSYNVYSYQGTFVQPYEYVLRDNVTGLDLGQGKDIRTVTVATDWYRSGDEASRNWEAAQRSQMGKVGQELLHQVNVDMGKLITGNFYTGSTTETVYVFYIKDKEEYADLDSAATTAVQAYASINAAQKGQHDSFAAAIAPAEAIWLRALAQQDTESKKARINRKAANLILFNLAWAAFWKNDFSAAQGYADKADENGKRDGWIYGFEQQVKERKARLLNKTN